MSVFDSFFHCAILHFLRAALFLSPSLRNEIVLSLSCAVVVYFVLSKLVVSYYVHLFEGQVVVLGIVGMKSPHSHRRRWRRNDNVVCMRHWQSKWNIMSYSFISELDILQKNLNRNACLVLRVH